MNIWLLLAIIFFLFAGPHIPVGVKAFLYTISIIIKEVLIFLLPVLIFCLLFKTTISLSEKATVLILVILVMVCLSNFVSTFMSHYVGMWVYSFDLSIVNPAYEKALRPLWNFRLFKIITNDKAMILGIVMGLICSKFFKEYSKPLAHRINLFTGKLLKFFFKIIPIFIVGFIVKLENDGTISLILKDYLGILLIIACAQISYLLLFYFVTNKLNLKSALLNIRNMLPAAFVGFTSMSSAASLPVAIVGVAKNAHDPDLSKAVIPATINIHLIGDCFSIPILAYAIMKTFDIADPTLTEYLVFTVYFVVAKFSVAAVPGGGILVMLPILEQNLGFTPEMLSMITALYILFDPVVTFMNILGNGAFARMIDNINKHFIRRNYS